MSGTAGAFNVLGQIVGLVFSGIAAAISFAITMATAFVTLLATIIELAGKAISGIQSVFGGSEGGGDNTGLGRSSRQGLGGPVGFDASKAVGSLATAQAENLSATGGGRDAMAAEIAKLAEVTRQAKPITVVSVLDGVKVGEGVANANRSEDSKGFVDAPTGA
jgi:hypothetical protein